MTPLLGARTLRTPLQNGNQMDALRLASRSEALQRVSMQSHVKEVAETLESDGNENVQKREQTRWKAPEPRGPGGF